MSTWKPIGSAPKDGTEILASTINGHVQVVWWEAYRSSGEWFHSDDGYTWPTHWMPLPEPPRDGRGRHGKHHRKLTDEHKAWARQERSRGMKLDYLAAVLKVNKSTVSRLCRT